MEKIHDLLLELMGTDGLVHCLVSAALTALLGVFLPWWCAVMAVLIAGIGKEAYDKYSGNGNAEMKDVWCNVVGIIIGAL